MAETTISDLRSDAQNANRGNTPGNEALEHSIDTYGPGRSVVTDKDGTLVAGNGTHAAAIRAGIEKIIVVESDGDALIVHKRRDLDFNSADPVVRARTRGASLADNQVGKVRQNIDMELVRQQLIECEIVPSTCGFTEADVVSISESVPGPTVEGDESEPAAPSESRAERIGALTDQYKVIVTLKDEMEQTAFLDQMDREGRECRALVG